MVNNSTKLWEGCIRSQDLMSRTSHLTSMDLMTLAEELNQKKSTTTTKGSNVMDVKGMDILELNALLISRNKRKDCQSPGLMKILRVILKKNQPNMSQPLLEFAILMKILVKMSYPLKSWQPPTESCVSEVLKCVNKVKSRRNT